MKMRMRQTSTGQDTHFANEHLEVTAINVIFNFFNSIQAINDMYVKKTRQL